MRNLDKRYVAAAAALSMLAALLYWQHRRAGAVADCIELGGGWDGPSASCKLPDNRILTRPNWGRG